MYFVSRSDYVDCLALMQFKRKLKWWGLYILYDNVHNVSTLQDTISVAEIAEKESKEMFPQGLPKDFVKQVHPTIDCIGLVWLQKVLLSQIEVAGKAQWMVRPIANTIFNSLDQCTGKDIKPRYLLCILKHYSHIHSIFNQLQMAILAVASQQSWLKWSTNASSQDGQ